MTLRIFLLPALLVLAFSPSFSQPETETPASAELYLEGFSVEDILKQLSRDLGPFLSRPEPEIDASGEFYLVTSADAELLEKLAAVSEPAYSHGRTMLVRLKIPYEELSPELQKWLKKTERGEVYNYPVLQKATELPDPSVSALLGKVSSGRILGYAEKLVYAGKRSASQLDVKSGSGNKLAMDAIAEALSGMGYSVERHCYRDRKYDKECNITARKPGASAGGKAIVIIAHLDSVGYENAGADDNASGAAGLLEMARVLADYKAGKEIIFVASNGEENGIAGGYAYVRKLKASGELARVEYAINMDMIAWNKDGIVEIETNSGFLDHANWVGTMAKLYTKLKPYVASPAWGSDHVPFLEQGIPTYLSIEHWETHTPCYHQVCDKLDGLFWDYAAEIVKLNLAVVASKSK